VGGTSAKFGFVKYGDEEVDNTVWSERTAFSGRDDFAVGDRPTYALQLDKRLSQSRMNWNAAAMATFGNAVPDFNDRSNAAISCRHHVPGQFRDFVSAKTCEDCEENDRAVAAMRPSLFDHFFDTAEIAATENFGLFSNHDDVVFQVKTQFRAPRDPLFSLS
jgi:hypothetical protein